MTRELKLRPEVAAFAQLMERQLRANDRPKGRRGWKDAAPGHVMQLAWDKVHQVQRELCHVRAYHGTPEKAERAAARLAGVAADLGNYMMMLADTTGGLE